ncbi:hypothetical protein EJB05_35784, partial [Eragrostis curvula]
MEAAAATAAAFVRGGSLVRARGRVAYGGERGPRRVVGGGLAAPGRRRVPVAVAAVPEPLPSRAEGGAVSLAPEVSRVVSESGCGGCIFAALMFGTPLFVQAGHEEVEINGDSAAETSSPSGGAPGKTVRVRFVLKKQCPFGQSFHLVGDDPALGLWDPSEAVALQWVEGHEWIVEKDLLANKLIEFKFLLRDTSGKLQWQDGPNRSLQTGETVNTLVVYEDWGDVKNQKIAEEGEALIGMEDGVVSGDSESRKDNVIEDELQMDDDKDVERDESIAPRTNPLLHEELKLLDQLREREDKKNGNTSCADERYAEKKDDIILSEDGVPVENGLTNAYEHDFLWGWKALQKLLMSLGFKMDTS